MNITKIFTCNGCGAKADGLMRKPSSCPACVRDKKPQTGYSLSGINGNVEDYNAVLKNKDWFKLAIDEMSKKIVGEETAKKIILLCAGGGRLVKNSQQASFNLLINDEAGTGKDYVTGAVLSIIPSEVYERKTKISPAVLNYWHVAQKEPFWDWNGKVLYLEDVSETILNSDVLKVMASSGSSATIVIDKEAVDLNIQGKPVIVCTTATATPNPELTRRFVNVNLDASDEQTRNILSRHSEYAESGEVPNYNSAILEAQYFLKPVKVIIPFARSLDKYLPIKGVIMRTQYPRFLDFIKASTAWHQYDRKFDSKGYLVAEGEDYELARECFLKLAASRFMLPLTRNQKNVLAIFEKEPLVKLSVSQLEPLLKGAIKNLTSIKDNANALVRAGILAQEVSSDSYGREMTVYKLDEAYNPSTKLSLPHYFELKRDATDTTDNTDCTDTTDNTKFISPHVQSSKEPVSSVQSIFIKVNDDLSLTEVKI